MTAGPLNGASSLALDAMRTGQTHYAHYGSAISDDIDS